jgi:hypothetical protein
LWLQVPRILCFGRHSVLYLAQSAHWYSQKMPVPYQHTPILGPRSIRILELQPAADPEVPISCKLRNISLSAFPQWHANYTALSYTWDGQSPSCEVDCDGANLLITPNCDAAIRQLRSATAIRILRIDSICIDQTPEAIEECNVQVALMGESIRVPRESLSGWGQAMSVLSLHCVRSWKLRWSRGQHRSRSQIGD